MAAFEVAALLVALAGLGVVGRTVIPLLGRPEPEEDDGPDLPADVLLALRALDERALLDDDDGTPWISAPLVPGDERLPSDLRPWDGVVTVGDGALLPLGTCLLASGSEEPVLRGRRQGRPLHAVRLREGLFFDLYEGARLLPVLAVELAARGLPSELLLDSQEAAAGRDLVAAWLVTGEGPRVLPEGDDLRSASLLLDGHPVRTVAHLPTLRRGLEEDALRWAGEITLDDQRSTGATSPADLTALDLSPTPPVGWTRRELLELAAVLQQLERQDVDLSAFLLEVFADRVGPVPDPQADPTTREEQGLVAAALLNWVGAAHRRSGRPRAGLAALDAAEAALPPDDDDTRGDVHHNRGLCWLDLRSVDPDALDAAVRSFQAALRARPDDADPWIQLALVHHLRDDLPSAAEAWLQAATRVPRDEERKAILLANAAACEPTPAEQAG